MLAADVKFGQTIDQVRTALGSELERADNGNITILRFTSHADTLADYVYFLDGKVVLLSLSRASDPLSTVNTIFPQFSQPDKVYYFQATNREPIKVQTFVAWYQNGAAVLIDGSQSTDHVVRTLVFEPMNESELFALWGPSKNIREEATYMVVEPVLEEVIEQPVSAPLTNLPMNYLGIGVGIVLICLLCGVVLLIKKRKKTVKVVEPAPVVPSVSAPNLVSPSNQSFDPVAPTTITAPEAPPSSGNAL